MGAAGQYSDMDGINTAAACSTIGKKMATYLED